MSDNFTDEATTEKEFAAARDKNMRTFGDYSRVLDTVFTYIFNQISVLCWIPKNNRDYFAEHARENMTVTTEMHGTKITKWTATIPTDPSLWENLCVSVDGYTLSISKHKDRVITNLVKIPLELFAMLTSSVQNR